MYNWNGQEDMLALLQREAVQAGEKARLYLELDEAESGEFDDEERKTMRRRLASTLVKLGVKIDPLVVEAIVEDTENAEEA